MNHDGKNLINLSRLLERFDHDRELVGEVMAVFVSETPERLRRFADAATQGDLEYLVRLAHSLKGVCGTMHAEPLRELSYQLEMAARTGEAQVAGALVPQVLTMLGDLSNYLETTAAGDLPPG